MGIDQTGDKQYDKWQGFINDALSCLDFDKYTWIHLPCDGGLYDQDEMFMTIWECIRSSFISAMRDDKVQKQLEMKRGK